MKINIQNIFNRVINKDADQDNPDAHKRTSFISSMFTEGYLQLVSHQNWYLLGTLTVVAFSAFFITKVWGLSISDVQMWVLPIAVIIFWFLPTIRTVLIFRILLVIVFVIWLFSLLHIRGTLASVLPMPRMIMAKIEGDNDGTFREELLREVKKKNRERGLSTAASIGSIHTDFSSLTQARHWLENAQQSFLVFFGNKNWVRLLVSDKYLRSLISEKIRPSDTARDMNTWLMNQAVLLDVDLKKDVVFVYPEGTDFPLLISHNVDFLNLPLKPLNLVTQYLSFFGKGLGINSETGNTIDELSLAYKRSWYLSAASTYGHWQSYGALGLAWFFVGNVDFYRGILMQEQPGDFTCAANSYNAAAAKAIARFDPAIVASIFNNYAIVTFLGRSADHKSIEKALFSALTTFNLDKTPTRGAKIALLNLMIMQKAGIL